MAITRSSVAIRPTYTGLSTDVKPTPQNVGTNTRAAGYVPPPVPGHRFVETDTGNVYVYVGDQGWVLSL